MKVEYSKAFVKAVKKLSGKMLHSVRKTIQETKEADSVEYLCNCEKLIGCKNIYRLRIGNLRAFFFLQIDIESNTVIFEYLVPRGASPQQEISGKLKEER